MAQEKKDPKMENKLTKETAAIEEFQFTEGFDLQTKFKEMGDKYLARRKNGNPEFSRRFTDTFGDLVFSRNSEEMEKLMQFNPNSLLNAIFKAAESGALFSKKQVSLIPMTEYKKTVKNGVESKVATGKYDAVLFFDINFQKQEILKMENCKKFFTAEVHEGVKPIEDLSTGNYIFVGENIKTKPTIGYYAVFITTEGEKYDLFMTNATIKERASSSPGYDKSKYENTTSNVHYEKIVIRNLLKDIPHVNDSLKTILAADEGYTEYVEIGKGEGEGEQKNMLEEAKKQLHENTITPAESNFNDETGEIIEPEIVHEEKPQSSKKSESKYF